jgi:hypothetical protein
MGTECTTNMAFLERLLRQENAKKAHFAVSKELIFVDSPENAKR